MTMRLAALLILAMAGVASASPLPVPAPREAPAAQPPVPVTRPQTAPAISKAPTPVALPGPLICEDPRLKGTRADNVMGHLPGCGILNPVKITEVAGIRMSTPAMLDCRTARAFANWVSGVAQPSAKRVLGRRIEKMWIMGTYACRTRNNRVGTRVSEHGAGRAIDIGGVWMGDGQRITVLRNWGKGDEGTFLAQIRERACGTFTTVLGPGSDRYHNDHLHLDTAYRDNRYCR